MKVEDVLVGLLEAEQAAVYAYGVLGAQLDVARRRLALAAFDAHRVARDDLQVLLGARAPGPAPEYDVRVAGSAQAMALAVRIETDLEGRWRDLVGTTAAPALRGRAVTELQASAVRAVQWRRLAGVRPLTEPFPGRSSPG